MMDQSDGMMSALAQLDYLTPSILCAKTAAKILRRSIDHDVSYDCKVLMGSWCLMLLNADSTELHHLAKTMLGLELLFLVEALVRLSKEEESEHAIFVSKRIIEAIQEALASPKDPLFQQMKQMWSYFAQRAEELARDSSIEIPAPPSPEFICGLPGCTSLTSATLRCKRCKQQCYCSLECQKPDWRRHKKFCKAAEE
ncbi:hypothetical protein DL93DRAFT_921304 [Clavulina sp. PMI_390]|nr:hypothetical protein DL93DRAFT_921304 [Clavulina sp. PMI_390]